MRILNVLNGITALKKNQQLYEKTDQQNFGLHHLQTIFTFPKKTYLLYPVCFCPLRHSSFVKQQVNYFKT